MEKLEWWVYPLVRKTDDMITCFDRTHKRDRQTDRQTDTARRHRLRLCIASRGKNEIDKIYIKVFAKLTESIWYIRNALDFTGNEGSEIERL